MDGEARVEQNHLCKKNHWCNNCFPMLIQGESICCSELSFLSSVYHGNRFKLLLFTNLYLLTIYENVQTSWFYLVVSSAILGWWHIKSLMHFPQNWDVLRISLVKLEKNRKNLFGMASPWFWWTDIVFWNRLSVLELTLLAWFIPQKRAFCYRQPFSCCVSSSFY